MIGEIRVLVLFLILGNICLIASGENYRKKMDLLVTVIDDKGKSVSNALVRGYFDDPRDPDFCGETYKIRTSENGIVVIKGHGYSLTEGMVFCKGYYDTDYKFYFKDLPEIKEGDHAGLRKMDLILKKRRHPIPMYVKRVRINIPEEQQDFGFDMRVGDWVKPHGRGKTADIYFRHFMERTDIFHITNTINVVIKDNMCGIQKLDNDQYSQFKTFHLAPEKGYLRELEFSYKRRRDKIFENTMLKKTEYLVFKCRPKYDEKGNLVSAHYGKIIFPLNCGKEVNAQFSELGFTYYFNPTPNDRNLEFAPKKSLFPPSRYTNIVTP